MTADKSINKQIRIELPEGARLVIDRLVSCGYKAYAVGGAVRDALLGKPFGDVDVATSATPKEVAEAFGDETVVPTGIKHGTVTVICGGEPYEVTTFRTDGGYSDGRHPDEVKFVGSVEDDLARRDFTVNALAYGEEEGIIDLYGGIDDLKRGVIRAVGDPVKRLGEDALRIARAVRFSSVLGFRIDDATIAAANAMRGELAKVSPERIFSELVKTLCGAYAADALLNYPEIIFAMVPELRPTYRFEQHSKWHKYDVYEHIARSVGNIDPDPVLRFSMLMHDVGKPSCFFMRDGEGHFYGHPKVSAEIAAKVLYRLKAPNAFRDDVLFYVARHDERFPLDEVTLKRKLRDFGEERTRGLFKVKAADNAAQGTALASAEIGKVRAAEKLVGEIVSRGDCYDLSRLAVNGDDLAAIGYSGRATGEALSALLDAVISGALPNERGALIKSAKKRFNKHIGELLQLGELLQ